jgi:hypothetical protein
MDKTLLQVAAAISKVETMADRSLRLKVDTQEMEAEDEAKVMKLRGKLGWFVFSDQNIDAEDIPDIKLDVEAGEIKSPSQRLRNTIYVYWYECTNKSIDFDTFYKQQMDMVISKFKEKLPN